MAARPVAPDLFTSAPTPRLIGGRDRATGRIVFPLPANNPDYEALELPTHGSLWSYTVQRFAPKSPPYTGPQPFEAFAIGYVELPDALIVESRLTEVAFDDLRLGLPMELTTTVLRTDPDGCEVLTYAFRPATDRKI